MKINFTKLCEELKLCGYELIFNDCNSIDKKWIPYEFIGDDYHASAHSIQDVLDISYALCYHLTANEFKQTEDKFKKKRQLWIDEITKEVK